MVSREDFHPALESSRSLVRVDIGTNVLVGAFPTRFSGLQALEVFSASNNNFTGLLPPDFAQLPAPGFVWELLRRQHSCGVHQNTNIVS
ncbi:hypothetical protein O6H91_Y113500 [Diphasiastrum complanatum]|nr:hypothetical protein O6H91_Y113500 [Diphasiastrum complanatum]